MANAVSKLTTPFKALWVKFRLLSLLLNQGGNAWVQFSRVLEQMSPELADVLNVLRPWMFLLAASVPFMSKSFSLYETARGLLKNSMFCYKVEVEAMDPLYKRIIMMANSLSTNRSTNTVLASLKSVNADGNVPPKIYERNRYGELMEKKAMNSPDTRPELVFEPSKNPDAGAAQTFKYNNKTFTLKVMPPVINHKRGLQESGGKLTLSCWALSMQPLRELLEDVKTRYAASHEKKTTIFTFSVVNGWDEGVAKPIRGVDSIVLPKAMKDELVSDLTNFLKPETRRWYTSMGLKYNRGLLFAGSPGVGKTSSAIALAGHLGINIFLIDLSAKDLTTDLLSFAFTTLPEKAMLLLEDIDSAGITREDQMIEVNPLEDLAPKPPGWPRTKPSKANRVTLSGLLNAIDGVNSREGRILIMSTNDVSALDDALIRPGRCDKHIVFPLLNKEMATGLFERVFLGPASDGIKTDEAKKASIKEQAAAFAAKIPDDEFTPATISNYLIPLREEPQKALDGVEEFLKKTREFNEAKRLQALKKKEEAMAKEVKKAQQTKANMTPESSSQTSPTSSSSPDADPDEDLDADRGLESDSEDESEDYDQEKFVAGLEFAHRHRMLEKLSFHLSDESDSESDS